MKILPCGLALPQTAQRSKTKLPIVSDHSVQSLPTDKVATSSSSSTALAKAESATGYSHSPFPSVDVFITSQLTKGGVQGSIRRWTYFPTGIYVAILYVIYTIRKYIQVYVYVYEPLEWLDPKWLCLLLN